MTGSNASVELARAIRIHALRMTNRAGTSHIGGCLSLADILAVLYESVLQVRPAEPLWPDRDWFILSKGHAAAVYFAVLAERGFFPVSSLTTFCEYGSALLGHVSSHGVPGVEFSAGSLGHGLGLGCGCALFASRKGRVSRTVVALSDGELDEGSTWEAVLFAAHHKLDRLIAIVDYNKIQGFGRVDQVMKLEPLSEKWRSFGWTALEIDGHDHDEIRRSLSEIPAQQGRPTVVIAHTVKGKGVSFMEDRLEWHYRSATDDQLAVRVVPEVVTHLLNVGLRPLGRRGQSVGPVF